jgi:hypothetical protein
MAGTRADRGTKAVRFCDELGFAFGWISARRARLHRASHALADEGRVWIVDPVDGEGVEERIRALGDPAAILQLLDRHSRDCAALAARLAVPHYALAFDHVPGAPFKVVPIVRRRLWQEVALWWPARSVLVCADALGTAPYYRGPGERLAVHPLLRLTPPRPLGAFAPRHVLVGHGEGVHGDGAAAAVRDALASSRRRAGRWAWRLAKEER